MNIKEWKKFSDEIDKFNEKNCDELLSEIRKLLAEPHIPYVSQMRLDKLLFLFILSQISKTETSFWEWKLGKLKLK